MKRNRNFNKTEEIRGKTSLLFKIVFFSHNNIGISNVIFNGSMKIWIIFCEIGFDVENKVISLQVPMQLNVIREISPPAL